MQLPEELAWQIAHKNGNGVQLKLNIVLERQITTHSIVPDVVPVIKIRDSIFAVQADLAFVTGLPKTGKTHLAYFMLATALSKEPLQADTLQIQSTYAGVKPVIYVDTEQPQAYTKQLVQSVCGVLGARKEPDNFFAFNLRSFSRKEKNQAVKLLMDHFPTTHLWIIDGIADLVSDVNNTEESFTLLDELMKYAEARNTCMVLYLHENPGTSKMRGNLGSEAERKCGGTITIKKDRKLNIHSIESRMMRGSADFENVYFHYNPQLRRMVSLDEARSRELNDKAGAKRQKLYQLAYQCFLGGVEQLNHGELLRRIENYDKVSNRTAHTRKREMLESEIICQESDNLYSLIKPEKITE